MKTQQILTAMAALALVAGCSGGKQAAKATPTPSADIHRLMLDIAQCARAHGAPNFPDPVAVQPVRRSMPQPFVRVPVPWLHLMHVRSPARKPGGVWTSRLDRRTALRDPGGDR
jgi:hypothetical protein